jgi:hypothetical protein
MYVVGLISSKVALDRALCIFPFSPLSIRHEPICGDKILDHVGFFTGF